MRKYSVTTITLVVLFSLLSLTINSMAFSQDTKDPSMLMSSLLLSDSEKAEILATYAPKVWLAGGYIGTIAIRAEEYFPSPVEFSFQHNARIYDSDTNNWWLHTDRDLNSPSDVLDYFHGCDGFPCALSDVPVYAFWDGVEQVQIGDDLLDVVDLIYYFWFPYNRGKEVWGTVYGNHVGDWEHVSIRLVPEWIEESEQWIYRPYQIYLATHNFGHRYSWDEIAKEETHPIVYAAWGSHGIWKDPGAHEYDDYFLFNLVDYCSAGTAWNTWQYVEAYDYDNQTGLIENAWPTWMSSAYADRNLGYTDPASGPIKRWGNFEDSCDAISGCRLENGPDGPVDKNVWDVQVLQ